MAWLHIIRGTDQGRRFEVQNDVVQLGRDKSNGLQLRDSEVSRRHAEIRRSGPSFQIVDLGSSNGTFVNGEKVHEHRLVNGDTIRLGQSVIVFDNSPPAKSTSSSQSVTITADPSDSSSSQIIDALEATIAVPQLDDEQTTDAWLDQVESNLQVIYRTAVATGRITHVDDLLDRILELVFEWVEADRGCIMLLGDDGSDIEPKATKIRDQDNPNQNIEISRTILEYVRNRREGVLTTNAPKDERWSESKSVCGMGIREAICVPMLGRMEIVGFIYVDTFTTPNDFIDGQYHSRFTPEQLRLMLAIGHQAALAVENTKYYSAMLKSERLAGIGQTIAVLSHHIKNILQGIRGGSFLIEDGLKERNFEVISEGWRLVEKNQDKISNLVLNMLSYSKPRDPVFVEADVNQVVSDVVELLSRRADQDQTRLEWKPTPTAIISAFDPEALHRAVLNVVLNALDACLHQKNAQISIRVLLDQSTREMRIVVADNGVGIPPEELDRVFTPFSSRKGSRGTGLGLPVSRKILNEHGGDIEVVSKPGEGSQFTLTLPIRHLSDDGLVCSRDTTLQRKSPRQS